MNNYDEILEYVNTHINNKQPVLNLLYSDKNPYLHTDVCKYLLAVNISESIMVSKELKFWLKTYSPEINTEDFEWEAVRNHINAVKNELSLSFKKIAYKSMTSMNRMVSNGRLNIEYVMKSDDISYVWITHSSKYVFCSDPNAQYNIYELQDIWSNTKAPFIHYNIRPLSLDSVRPGTLIMTAAYYKNVNVFETINDIYSDTQYDQEIWGTLSALYIEYGFDHMLPFIQKCLGVPLTEPDKIKYIESISTDFDDIVEHIRVASIANDSDISNINLPVLV